MQWFRLYGDAANDPKWRLIAARAGCRTGDVWAVATRMLCVASEAEDRGSLASWDDEIEAVGLDFDPETVAAIRAAMEGRFLEGGRIRAWEKRQPSEPGTAAERMRAYRERKKLAEQEHGDNRNGDVTLRNAPSRVTPVTSHVTRYGLEEKREEEKREERKNPPYAPPLDAATASACPPPPIEGGTLPGIADEVPAKPKGGRAAKRGTRIPDDWRPDAGGIAHAAKCGLRRETVEVEIERFRDYWAAKPDGLKLDWPATWRNWCRSAAERQGGQAARSPPKRAGFYDAAMSLADRLDGATMGGHDGERPDDAF